MATEDPSGACDEKIRVPYPTAVGISIIEEDLKGYSLPSEHLCNHRITYGFKGSQEFVYRWMKLPNARELEIFVINTRRIFIEADLVISDHAGYPTLDKCVLPLSELSTVIDLLKTERILFLNVEAFEGHCAEE